MSAEPEPCAFCRVGSCAIHGVMRFVAPPGRRVAATPDEAMAEVGCCDDMEAAIRWGVFKVDADGIYMPAKGQRWRIRRCPFCPRLAQGGLT